MVTIYLIVEFLDLAKAARDALKAARNQAEQAGMYECAEAVSAVIDSLDAAERIVYAYEVKPKGEAK